MTVLQNARSGFHSVQTVKQAKYTKETRRVGAAAKIEDRTRSFRSPSEWQKVTGGGETSAEISFAASMTEPGHGSAQTGCLTTS